MTDLDTNDIKKIKSLSQNNQQLNLEDIVYLTNKIGMELVNAKEESERLDLLKATYRARAMEKYDDGNHSEAKIRRLAETDKDYIIFLEELGKAKSKADKLKIRYDSYKNLFEARRSMLSYQKAEMSLI